MKQVIGLLSIIVLITVGQTSIFAQGQPQWVLEKKAKKEVYKKDKNYYKDKMKVHEVENKRHHKNRQHSKSKAHQNVNKQYNGKRGGRTCGTKGRNGERTDRGTYPNRRVENRRGNTNTSTPYPRTTTPTNEKVKVITQPTTTPTNPRVIVNPQPTPTTTPTTTPTDGGLKGRRTAN